MEVAVGDIRIPAQGNGSIWLRYSRHDPSRFVSAADVLAGKADPELFRSKLVLVGVTGLGLLDFQATPLGERVPGVEVHAQLIEQVFDGDFLVRPAWAKWLEAALLLLAVLLLMWIVPARRVAGLDRRPWRGPRRARRGGARRLRRAGRPARHRLAAARGAVRVLGAARRDAGRGRPPAPRAARAGGALRRRARRRLPHPDGPAARPRGADARPALGAARRAARAGAHRRRRLLRLPAARPPTACSSCWATSRARECRRRSSWRCARRPSRPPRRAAATSAAR